MRTDLAHESNPKPQGNYVTLFCDERDTDKDIQKLTKALSGIIEGILPDVRDKKILVVGLGNENITPDSLGVRAAAKILATAHFTATPELRREFDELGLREVCVISPGVMAQTGLETAQQLRFITDGIKPDCIIAIDSLACNSTARLAKTIQLTDTGISPGSGVANNRRELSRDTLGAPVIAVGVPLVIDMVRDDSDNTEPFMVVPRDIDVIVNHYARVISAAVNRTLNPELDETEIEQLLF
ncbi:MAG: GPR endopeptidase [Oscillospiraceae bacterium]|nr:GPR endopeptidase [Oscillospiraceae bacterium]